MSKKLRKSSFVEGTIIATLSIFIVKILGMLYVIPFYATVGIQGSALYAYAYNIYVIFLDISTAGLPIAISKIINEYNTLGKMDAKQRAYNIGKRILGIAAISIFIILFIFATQIATALLGDLEGGNTIKDVALAIRCVSFAILVVPFLSVSKGYLQGHNIINVSSTSQVIEQIVRIAIILIGSYVVINVFNKSVTTAVCVAVTGAFFSALIAYLYVTKKIKDNKKQLEVKSTIKDEDITNKEITKKIISYAVPFIIINIIYSLYNFTDMVLVLRTMDYIGFSALDTEFIASTISTWSTKISIIISSIAMGMTVSLIPTIVSAFTLKNYDEVNSKLNQALQMIILISLPMTVGLSILNKPVWSIFYGIENVYGYRILAIAVWVAFIGNIFSITGSTLQSLNKFKLVYKSTLLGLLLNAILDVPLMLLYNYIGLPSYLGASSASIIGYTVSTVYALYSLKKEHTLKYIDTFILIKKLILPTILMVMGVLICMVIVPVNYDSKLSCIIYISISAIVGASIYLGYVYKKGIMNNVFKNDIIKKVLNK